MQKTVFTRLLAVFLTVITIFSVLPAIPVHAAHTQSVPTGASQPVSTTGSTMDFAEPDGVVESPHNYYASMDESWTIFVDGAESISLSFSSSTKVENNYDKIYIYDQNNSLYGTYTGTQLASKVINIDGDRIRIRLVSDYTIQYYGFRAEYKAYFPDLFPDAVEYSLPYQSSNGLYAYAGAKVAGTNAWQRWNSGSDGRYFFLPPTASESQVIVLNTYSESVTLNGLAIPAGHYRTVPYKEGVSYSCTGATTQSVRIYKTDAEGSIFINSADGMTTKNDAGVKSTEDATFDLYSFITSGTKNQEAAKLNGAVASKADGVDEVDTTIKKLKGRGNTTWDLDKKPFNITFDETVTIDNMKGKKWSLLANAQDPSLMRNRMVYDLANEVNMRYACDSRFVDMFVNGVYKGSYQLTQKIELGKNTVMPDLTEPEVEDIFDDYGMLMPYPKENFDFVLELDMAKKAASAGDLTFTTARGQVMTHKIPDEPAVEQIAFMKAKYQALEDALYTNDMSKLEALIDLEDLAKAYLINEITKNLDAALTSCYFVYNSSEDIFFASPVWDFDNGVGNTVGISDRKDSSGNVLDITKPDGWYARELMHIDSSFTGGRTIFSQACYMTSKTSDGRTFWDIVKEVWADEFADAAEIISGELQAQNGRLNSKDGYLANLLKSGQWNYSNGGWELSNNTVNSWIANHSSLQMYTYNAQDNTISSEKNRYDQTTFRGQADYAADWLVSRLNWLSAQFAGATAVVPDVDYTTVYFTKPADWADVYIYGFYGVEGGSSEAVWPADYPGGKMNYVGLDEYGRGFYSIKVPSDVDYIKFSDGSANNRRTNNVPNSMIVENVAFYVTTQVSTYKWDIASYIYNPDSSESTDATESTEVTEASTNATEATKDEPDTDFSDYVIRGSFTNWDSTERLKYAEGSTTVLEAVYTVSAGTYYFKIHDLATSAQYGNDGTIDSECSNWGFRVYNKYTGLVTANCGWAAESGTYKFLIDVADTSRIGVSVIYLGAEVPEETEPTAPATTTPATTQVPTTSASVTPEYITVYFTNAWVWTDVSVYYRGSAFEPDTIMPGRSMTYVETNSFGQDIYSATIPADVDYIRFTGKDNGAETQSPDVTDIKDGYGYYMDWNETDGTFVGSYEYVAPVDPTTTAAASSEATQPATDEATEPATGDTTEVTTIYLKVNNDWPAADAWFAAYYWNAADEYGWVTMTATKTEGIYTAEVPADTTGLIFTRRNPASTELGWNSDTDITKKIWNLTADINMTTDLTKNMFVLDAGWSSISGTWTEYDVNATTPTLPNVAEDTVVYFTNSNNWANVNVYTWGGAGASKAWPGDAMQLVGTNAFGQDIYTVVIPAGTEGFLFNGMTKGDEGNAFQTVDVELDTVEANIGYYPSEQVKTEGDADIDKWLLDTFTYTEGDVTPNESLSTDEPEEKGYVVIFLDYDDKFIDYQVVSRGEAATAPEAPTRKGYNFVGWDTEFDNITSNLTIKAVYEKIPTTPTPAPTTGSLKVEVVGGTSFTIAVDGSGARPQGPSYMNSKMPIGASVTVKANSASGAQFIGWQNSVTGAVLSTEQEYTFLASGNDSIKAMFAVKIDGVQMVTFKNSKAGNFGRVLDSQYYASTDAVSFPDAPTQVGYDFAGWSMTEAEIKSAIANGEDVTVTAQWTKSLVPVEVTVNGGTGSGTYYANNAVTVTANEAETGEKFAYWTDAEGNIRSYSAEYTFFPATDTTVTAVFVDEDEAIDYQILVSLDSIDTTTVEGKNVFTYSWYCPEEYTFVKAGIVAVNKDNYNEATFVAGSSDANVYDRSPSGDNLKPVNTFTWTKSNVASGQTWVAKAYVQYRDAEGQLITVYSDMVEATKE